MSLKIMVDSSSGISVGEGKEIGVDVFPLKIAFGEQKYADGVDLTLENFYDRLLNGKEFPKTSLPNLYAIEKQIARYKEEGHTVLILPLAKELSGTYAASKSSRKNLRFASSIPERRSEDCGFWSKKRKSANRCP